jgi:response regulator of citrate/malate metabolism
MNQRPDSAVYQRARTELVNRHRQEFEQIRAKMLEEEGLDIITPNPSSNRAQALLHIASKLQVDGVPPTFREIGRALQVSSETARKYVRQLAADKLVEYAGPTSSLQVTVLGQDAVRRWTKV